MPKGGRRSTSFKPGVLALRVGAPIGKRRSPKRGRCSGIAASSLDTRGPPSGQPGARRHREYLGGDNPVSGIENEGTLTAGGNPHQKSRLRGRWRAFAALY